MSLKKVAFLWDKMREIIDQDIVTIFLMIDGLGPKEMII